MRLKSGIVRLKRLNVMVFDSEKRMLAEIATYNGLTVSALLRILIREAHGQHQEVTKTRRARR